MIFHLLLTLKFDRKAELQNRMASQMNDGLANWERDRRVTSCPDYEEKQLLALNGKFFIKLSKLFWDKCC